MVDDKSRGERRADLEAARALGWDRLRSPGLPRMEWSRGIGIRIGIAEWKTLRRGGRWFSS